METALELERLRQQRSISRPAYSAECDRSHIGPVGAGLMILGGLVVLGAILGSRD
jgi:hypothetical protein